MHPLGRVVVALLAPLASLQPSTAGAQQRADLILVDGVIHTMDPRIPTTEALAAIDGEIVALGPSDEIFASWKGPETVVIDAGGAPVLPGLIDAHAHVMGLGAALRTLDLVGTDSAEEAAAVVAAATAEREPGEWILGRGWDQNDWAVKEFPTRELLDRAAPQNPVYLSRVDGHAVWVNSAALAAGEVTNDTPDPEGGRVERDASGEPTGVLVDNAESLVFEAIPEPDEEELITRLQAAQDAMARVGLTGVHVMGADSIDVRLYRHQASEGRLVQRLAVYLSDGATVDWWNDGGAASTVDSQKLRVRGVKFYADGALGSRGAALLEPYSDDPGNRGLYVTDPDTLAERVARALDRDLQPAIHAIGDAGVRAALDAIEAASPSSGRRPRIEHSQVIALEDIPRYAELGVIASYQPTHATSDMYWAEDRVGPERIQGAYAWRRMRDTGARLACGSDFPVESPNPFFGIYAAVTRQDQEGWPEGGWRPEERMTREEALACFTLDAAWAAGMEDEVGTLAVGKRADFIVVDRDPLTAPAEDLWKIRVLRTVIDGETVYEAGE
ncbi:MAG TPA: amidohydrolase family protein [Gemmatimonadota bacterium]|nr:amidohydrolase family protein [Gemmatimonadota bacterium]